LGCPSTKPATITISKSDIFVKTMLVGNNNKKEKKRKETEQNKKNKQTQRTGVH
jgi:hypothetical protein